MNGPLGVPAFRRLWGQGLFVVVFVTERLGGGAAEVGLLRGVQAVGGHLDGLLVGVLARRLAPGSLPGVSPVGFAALGWNGPHVTTALVFYLAVGDGPAGRVAGAGMMSVLQLHASDEVRGRVVATFVSLYDGGSGARHGARRRPHARARPVRAAQRPSRALPRGRRAGAGHPRRPGSGRPPRNLMPSRGV